MKKLAILLSLVLIASFAWAGTWKALVLENSNGGYNALVEYHDDDGNVTDTKSGGTYESKRKAKRAAKNLEKALNDAVKLDPECDDPNFDC